MRQSQSVFEWYGPLMGVCLLFILGLVLAGTQAEAGRGALVLLWGLAWTGVGALLGFLFGIPRVLQGTLSATPTPPAGAAPAGAPAASSPASPAATVSQYLQRVNTNLEQVSDWLTKILLGVGLVEFKALPQLVKSAAGYMATGMGALDASGQPSTSAQTLASAVLIYFSVLGFVGSYLLMRLYISRLLYWADQPEVLEPLRSALDVSQVEPYPFERELPEPTLQVAQDYASKSLQTLTSERDVRLWAKAQLLTDNADKAVDGYRLAVQYNPDRPRLWFEYALALYEAGRRAEAKEKLLEALRRLRVTDKPSKTLKENIYKALTYYSLYEPPPDGFMDAIRYGEEYVQDPRNLPSGAILVNLACGYGQQYRWLEEKKGDPQERAKARARALEIVQQTLRIENGRWRSLLLELMLKEARKNPEDNDLEVFEKDPEFRRALGLPADSPA